MKINSFPLPHFNQRPENVKIDTIVIHSMYAKDHRFQTSAINCFKILDENNVSSHYSIDKQGNIWQHVDTINRAWHAGKSKLESRENVNDFSIGIELIGVWGQRFRAKQYKSLNSLLVKLCKEFPIKVIVSHQKIAPERKQDPGPSFRWDIVKRAMRKANLNLGIVR